MRTLDLGGLIVDRVAEDPATWLDPAWLFPNIVPADLERHRNRLPAFLHDPATGRIRISVHSYLVRAGGLNILIDACVGNDKERPRTPFWHRLAHDRYLSDLARHGLRPEDIDMVMCTHLHTDHVGWNTRLENGRWVPTFPNARYLFGRREFDHQRRVFEAEAPAGPVPFSDSVLPVVEAGRAELVEADHGFDLDDGGRVSLRPAPGHTPGHVCVHLRGRTAEGLASGDMIHHPIQFAEPHLINMADADPAQARRTREEMLGFCADEDVFLLPGHFPGPTVGKVVRHRWGEREGFDFRFRDEGARTPLGEE
ncbi:MAG: MBL fold metallo-hydrolase [Pseudomonadota bacterium]|nr:MBL fold metallo-hydrolase [Pseudomonadota bacterium]MEE3101906.1 MBL fold metallo-hydrolase [Pseudomonadota bacterium]